MTDLAIPFLLMRGGSSRGPYFNKADVPEDRDELRQFLINVVGSGHPLNIDGIGGGDAVTTKVAILSTSDDHWADVDYFFAQVSVETRLVDFKPTCGNILSGVGPAAIEMGLVSAAAGITEIKIRSVNTGARVLARVQTPSGKVRYHGDTCIDGVPGSASPIELNFMDVAGSSVGALLPTGQPLNTIKGIDVTCIDVAMPMVIARAADFGLTGSETQHELDNNRDFFEQIEAIRIEAGEKMGLGDCRESVTPKFGLLAPLTRQGHILARYFMPWKTHPTMAVTGGQALATCALIPGTVAEGMMHIPNKSPANIVLHHPMGKMDVVINYDIVDGVFKHHSAGLIRTCRKLAEGKVFVTPSSLGT